MLAQEIYDKYEPVIGLEIHAQLLTKSKMYSSDANEYGSSPNTNISPISLGHPGTLPVLNKKAVEYAVKMGIACECSITPYNEFARKNYFYADMPKGYQITQDTTPVCTGGFITIKTEEGKEKKVRLTRIHMEEDSGKSIHDQDPFNTLIDLNRAGVPLIEIVSEPDIQSAQQAYNYLQEVRKLVRYLGICDGNMEEGSLRCDANISIRLKGAKEFGQRVEVKNMNSINNVKKAIEHEFKRHVEIIEKGERVAQDTRSFDAGKGTTFSMRAKEGAHDYRYFPEPDLQPLTITSAYIEEVRLNMPPLPNFLFKKYIREFGLSEYDSGVLTEEKGIALYFEELIEHTSNFKSAANWVMVNIKSYLNENAVHIEDFTVKPVALAELIQLIDDGKISHSVAAQKVFPLLILHPDKKAITIAEENNWIQVSDSGELEKFVEEAIAKFPDKVEVYKSGQVGLLGLFMGEVMKLSKGKADPKLASQLLKEKLS
jgi:aspartyl-tRNA(Asn)/glutamyl-tRNA(Gln) amidotransferase subunit B